MREFLCMHGCDEHTNILLDTGFDSLDHLCDITTSDMLYLGMSLEQRVRLRIARDAMIRSRAQLASGQRAMQNQHRGTRPLDELGRVRSAR